MPSRGAVGTWLGEESFGSLPSVGMIPHEKKLSPALSRITRLYSGAFARSVNKPVRGESWAREVGPGEICANAALASER